MQAVGNSARNDIGVIGSLQITVVRVKCCRVLTEQFNVLLCMLTSLVDSLGTLSSSLCELLVLILDLGVQTVENGEDSAFELFGCLIMLVG